MSRRRHLPAPEWRMLGNDLWPAPPRAHPLERAVLWLFMAVTVAAAAWVGLAVAGVVIAVLEAHH